MKITPGRIETYHPAPDELPAFACINVETDLADCSYMIAESIEDGRILNVGLGRLPVPGYREPCGGNYLHKQRFTRDAPFTHLAACLRSGQLLSLQRRFYSPGQSYH
ncbi:MAG: hypothetical protein GX142_04395 [Chloroflexi bacterium]|nr:hypothetical protein [Chloroflexota bacterium]